MSSIIASAQKNPVRNSDGVFLLRELHAGQNHEFVASVLRAAIFLARDGAGGMLLTVADQLKPRRIDTPIRQVAVNGRAATLAQCQIVLIRAAVVGVALDAYANARVALQCVDLLVERLKSFVRYLRAVELEVDRRRDRGAIRGPRLRGALGVVGAGVVGAAAKLRVFTVGGLGCSAIG